MPDRDKHSSLFVALDSQKENDVFWLLSQKPILYLFLCFSVLLEIP